MGTDEVFHKRKARRAKDLVRQQARRAPYDKVLIVCEGEKTEPYYFKELKEHYKLDSANVEITGQCDSSPMCVVRYARQRYREAQKAGDAFDTVFCVFDKDTHGDYRQALDTLGSAKPMGVFKAIHSVPCFEYWLLLHFDYTDQPFYAAGTRSVGAMALQRLKQHWPEYEKASRGVFEKTVKNLEIAKTNAVYALSAAQANQTENPSTRVHELVAYLQQLKNRRASN